MVYTFTEYAHITVKKYLNVHAEIEYICLDLHTLINYTDWIGRSCNL